MILAYTVKKQGNKVLLQASDGRQVLLDNWSDLVTELLTPCDFAVCWNLDAFVDTVSVLFPKGVSQKLKEGGRAWLPGKEKLYFQPGRVFAVTYIKEVNFYGLARYSDTEPKDVNELLAFGLKVVEAYAEMGIKATKLTSPVALYPLDRVNYPRACDLPESALPLINATHAVQSREWRDVYKLGHWAKDEVADYDISAAYPSIMAGLPDISKAEFFTDTEIPTHFTWGEMTGKLKITKQVSPFYNEKVDGFPVGEWTDSITTDQLWLLKRWGIGEFRLEKGNFFQLPNPPTFPFKAVMEKLYQARDTQNPIVSNIAKAISVGIGGKLAQRYDDGKLGTDFNSIYARMTTSRCMVKVCDFIYRNAMEASVVSCLVDGCLTTKQLDVPNIKRMGAWRKNDKSPALVASLLYQWLSDKKPNGKTYSEMFGLIKQKPQSSVCSNVDLNLLEYSRIFPKLPHNFLELLENKYDSTPINITE